MLGDSDSKSCVPVLLLAKFFDSETALANGANDVFLLADGDSDFLLVEAFRLLTGAAAGVESGFRLVAGSVRLGDVSDLLY